jgi:hypothetical protein
MASRAPNPHAFSQQTVSTQKPVWHWLLLRQRWPSGMSASPIDRRSSLGGGALLVHAIRIAIVSTTNVSALNDFIPEHPFQLHPRRSAWAPDAARHATHDDNVTMPSIAITWFAEARGSIAFSCGK